VDELLLIDDDTIARKAIAKFLKRENFQVLEAENGEAGLYLFHKHSPDIVVTDVRMPKVDGLQVATEVRDISNFVQIILMSGYYEIIIIKMATYNSVLACLKKPLDLDELIRVLDIARQKIAELKFQAFDGHFKRVEERRLYPRYKVIMDLKIFADGLERKGIGFDISKGGICFVVEGTLVPGAAMFVSTEFSLGKNIVAGMCISVCSVFKIPSLTRCRFEFDNIIADHVFSKFLKEAEHKNAIIALATVQAK